MSNVQDHLLPSEAQSSPPTKRFAQLSTVLEKITQQN